MLTAANNPGLFAQLYKPRTPAPVTPAAPTTSYAAPGRRTLFGVGPSFGQALPTFSLPGQRIGSAPAPLASPSIGQALTPASALAAAVAGARAAAAATAGKGGR